MGVLRDSGSTRLTLTSLRTPKEPGVELLDAVRETAASEYEVFGEIGRSPDGTVAYLARDRHDGKLVALRLQQDRDQGYSIGLTKVLQRALDPPDQNPRKPRGPK